jgi:FMN-binding domain
MKGPIPNGCFLVLLLFSAIPERVYGREDYLAPEEFLQQAFDGHTVRMNKVWIKGELKKTVTEILGHELNLLRLRYWELEGKTAWILEEIGKEEPFTMGFVVHANRIEQMEVLAFRESRGWEIRYPFFKDQFRGAGLRINENQLDREIDGITGATLSVTAATRLARLALVLHDFVQSAGAR